MANAEYYRDSRGSIARIWSGPGCAYELIYQLNHHLIEGPRPDLGPKTIPQTRTGRALADPMIYLNVTSVMRRCDPEHREVYDARAKQCVEDHLPLSRTSRS